MTEGDKMWWASHVLKSVYEYTPYGFSRNKNVNIVPNIQVSLSQEREPARQERNTLNYMKSDPIRPISLFPSMWFWISLS